MTDETSLQPESGTTSTSVQRTKSWIAWHAGELAAVGLPAAGAVTLSGWWWAVAGLAGTAWVTHETRQTRQRRALRQAPPPPAVPAASEDRETETEPETAAGEQSSETSTEVRHA